ncbi:MAG: helix-turn-helix domain-containing protein [Hyphomicrobiales bacterium]
MNETLEDLVARSALMRGTSEVARAHLRRARLSLRSLAAGECVFRPGDAADAIYFLLGARAGGDGLDVDPLVQVELKPSSGKRTLRFERIVHGEIFGELELLEHGLMPKAVKRTTSAFALTPAAVVPLPLSLLSDLVADDALLRARLIRIGSQRLLSALTQQHEKVHTYPDLLLADWLVELSADIGIAEGNRVRFPRKIAQSDIAADLGVSRETISRRLNEWERSGLLRTGARSQQIEIIDYQRISRLASLRTACSRAALDRTIDDIDAAIASGDLIRARNIGLDILRYYPSSPELHHRTALAAARSGDARGALELLTRSGLPMDGDLSVLEDAIRKARRNPFLPMERILADPFVDDGFGEDEPEPATERDSYWENQLVEDVAALHARLLKERAFEASGEAARRELAKASFDAYHRLYAARAGYYPGINAATMALCAGDPATARKIGALLTATLKADAEDYWPLATLAEALLIVDRGGEAKDVLLKAKSARGADDGAKASTILQFRRIGTVLDMNFDVLVDALRPRNVAAISGHMFRGNELDAAAQDATEAEIRKAAEKLFTAHNVGFVYGALACGSDIILAETALKLGAEFEAVLPFNTERFIETSVKIGDPPGEEGKWEKRARAILEGAHGPCTLTIMDPQEPVERDLDGYFFYGFRYAAGCALQRAAMLQTACGLIVVSDDTEPGSIAGTNRIVADWRKHGRPFDVIPYSHKRPPRPSRERGETAFRPVVFLWDGAPEAKGADANLDKLFKKVGKGIDRIERTHRDGRRGCCLVTETTEQALATGRAAVEAAQKAKHPLRIICDFGLVLGASLKPDKKLVARLQSADDLPGLPLDCVLATEAYAAQAKFDLGGNVLLVPVGRAEASPTTDDGERHTVRSRPSLPIFTVERARNGARKV